jgi:hypothetical protein
MVSQTGLRQRDRRFSLFRPQKASVEFSWGGRPWLLPLVDVSVAGLSFVTDEEVPGLGVGARIEGASMRIAGCEIRGNVAIRHATPHPDWTTLYGGIFYPAEEADLLKLSGVLAGIEALENPRAAVRGDAG